VAEFLATGTEYDIELTKEDVPCQVKVGGKTEKFVPNINMQKWDDECWLNINHPDIVGAEKETVKDDKVELSVGNNTHRFYEKNGHLEYEIELKTKPLTNKIELDLNFPKGLKFTFQPALSQEHIDLGCSRPDNVVGSYTAYWKEKNNQYKTGKFCHIYRPKVIDADAKEEWCDIDIVGKILTITIPQKWMDSALFPVTIDPDLGYNTEGASDSTFGGAIGSIATSDGAGGQLVSAHMYANDQLGESLYAGAVWLDSDDSLVDESSQGTTPAGDTTQEYNITFPGTPYTILASTAYWVGAASDNDGAFAWKYDVGSGGDGSYDSGKIGSGFPHDPANWNSKSTDTFQCSIWMVYAGAAGTSAARIGVFGNPLMGPLGSVLN